MLHATRTFLVRQKVNSAWQGIWKRRLHHKRTVPDRGLGGHVHAGDLSLTEYSEYASSDPEKAYKATKALQGAHERITRGQHAAAVGQDRVASFETYANPSTPAEVEVDDRENARAIGLTSSGKSPTRQGDPRSTKVIDPSAQQFDSRMIRGLKAGVNAKERAFHKYPIMPGQAGYKRFASKLVKQHTDDLKAEELRDKLASEDGIYGRDRIDAYMLDNETIFPNWVRMLEPQLRTKVMYGALGLTEADEVIRQNLMQLPTDERQAQWARIKAAKSYQAGEERMLTPEEIRNERLGKRKSWYLHQKRQNRDALIRRLSLKRPDKWTMPAMRGIDLSHRLSVVARHIEAKVQTNGQWPLDESRLQRAKDRLERNNARETFLSKQSEHQRETINRVSPALREAMKNMSTERRDDSVKRISRRAYSFRLQAVKDGHQDEHGRKFIKLSRLGRTDRTRELRGQDAFEMENRRVFIPNIREGDRTRPNSELSKRYDGRQFAFNADPRSGL